ncbi:hypothetical protein [Gorillibacterium timonense]|uniref:hypothetical protein n=1 Tax=Gorillibacterium timonense TaxID=1689269 RepID=UPI00071D2A5F|nr:hypothetical protein [Gorillibacterium timonense]
MSYQSDRIMCVGINETDRIAELDAIKKSNPEFSSLVDQAIASGKTAGQLAFSILRDRSVAQKLADTIVAEINKGRTPSSDVADQSVHSTSERTKMLTDFLVNIINQNHTER